MQNECQGPQKEMTRHSTECHGEDWLAQSLLRLPACTTVGLRQTHFLSNWPVFFWGLLFKNKECNRLSRKDDLCHQANPTYQRESTHPEKILLIQCCSYLGLESLWMH